MAVPHSGMLGKPAETWVEDGDRDRAKPVLWYRNKQWTFAELAHERRNEGYEKLLTLEERTARAARCAKALVEMRRLYEANKPDITIILGKDQQEIWPEISPSLAIYTGDTIYNGPPQRKVYAPDAPVTYPAHPELALYLTKWFQNDNFDLTDIFKWPKNTWMKPPSDVVPHAYGFIYRQIMSDRPTPSVPILMNTFYPPTQPSFRRALMFAKSLYKAIEAWDSDKKVAIIASGGLTHFVCDEQLDKVFMESFMNFDFERLAQVNELSYQSGTSEVKLYVSVLWAAAQMGWKTNIVDYVPCYRTEAGTGEGMGFFAWTPNP
jgi:3-O-methylgallate 3,4-dioxygenase